MWFPYRVGTFLFHQLQDPTVYQKLLAEAQASGLLTPEGELTELGKHAMHFVNELHKDRDRMIVTINDKGGFSIRSVENPGE